MTNQPLEVKNSVLVIPRRLNIARHLSVQVLPFMLLIIFQQSVFFGNSLISISLQLLLPNGKTGANGPNAVCPVAKDPNCEPELAVERSLEVTTNVLGNLQRLGNARYQNAKVFHPPTILVLQKTLQL